MCSYNSINSIVLIGFSDRIVPMIWLALITPERMAAIDASIVRLPYPVPMHRQEIDVSCPAFMVSDEENRLSLKCIAYRITPASTALRRK